MRRRLGCAHQAVARVVRRLALELLYQWDLTGQPLASDEPEVALGPRAAALQQRKKKKKVRQTAGAVLAAAAAKFGAAGGLAKAAAGAGIALASVTGAASAGRWRHCGRATCW